MGRGIAVADQTLSESSGEPPRLDGDTVADRLNRLFRAFPDPETKQPYTNAKAARLITEMGTPIHENTVAGARRGDTEPSLKHTRAIVDLFPDIDPGYLMPGTRADKEAIAAQNAPPGAPTLDELRALARLFKAPEEVLTADTPYGREFDQEIQTFLAMREAQVQAFALRLRRESDEHVKQQMLDQLKQAGHLGRRLTRRRSKDRRAPDGAEDSDGST